MRRSWLIHFGSTFFPLPVMYLMIPTACTGNLNPLGSPNQLSWPLHQNPFHPFVWSSRTCSLDAEVFVGWRPVLLPWKTGICNWVISYKNLSVYDKIVTNLYVTPLLHNLLLTWLRSARMTPMELKRNPYFSATVIVLFWKGSNYYRFFIPWNHMIFHCIVIQCTALSSSFWYWDITLVLITLSNLAGYSAI